MDKVDTKKRWEDSCPYSLTISFPASQHEMSSYSAQRSNNLLNSLYRIKNEGVRMSEERLLFEIERILIDSIQVLEVSTNDPATLDLLFSLVSNMGNARLGIPPHKNVHSAIVGAEQNTYEQSLENMIRPAMYELVTESVQGTEAAVFVYRCFDAAAAITLYDYRRFSSMYDFRFAVDTARKARDVVGEWLDK